MSESDDGEERSSNSYCLACGSPVSLQRIMGASGTYGYRCEECEREIRLRLLNETALMNHDSWSHDDEDDGELP